MSLKYLFKGKKSIRLGLFGAGMQGHTQTEAISKVFDIEELRVYGESCREDMPENPL